MRWPMAQRMGAVMAEKRCGLPACSSGRHEDTIWSGSTPGGFRQIQPRRFQRTVERSGADAGGAQIYRGSGPMLSGFRHQHWLCIQLPANAFQIALETLPRAGILTADRYVDNQPRIGPSA